MTRPYEHKKEIPLAVLWGVNGYVKVIQSCSTLCDPMNCTVRGILKARMLEWVAVFSSRGSSQPRDKARFSNISGGFYTI